MRPVPSCGVCLPPRSCILSKPVNISSFFHRRVATPFQFFDTKLYTAIVRRESPNCCKIAILDQYLSLGSMSGVVSSDVNILPYGTVIAPSGGLCLSRQSVATKCHATVNLVYDSARASTSYIRR